MNPRSIREGLMAVVTLILFLVVFLRSVDFNWGWRRQICVVVLDGAPWVALHDGSLCRE